MANKTAERRVKTIVNVLPRWRNVEDFGLTLITMEQLYGADDTEISRGYFSNNENFNFVDNPMGWMTDFRLDYDEIIEPFKQKHIEEIGSTCYLELQIEQALEELRRRFGKNNVLSA